MAEKIIKGRDLMVFDNDGHSYAYATNHTFTMTAETMDISTKDHGIWSGSEVSKFSWEITSENLYTVKDYDKLFTAMVSGQPIKIRFGLKTDQTDMTQNVADGSTSLQFWTAGSTYYEGSAIITSLVTNSNNGENATYSITFHGTGSIKKTSAPV